jgi:uracil-DNA glycosylase
MPLPNWLKVLNAEVIACTRCPRLVAYRELIAREKRRAYRDHDYWGKPVPGFGDPHARVLVLGLAPGAHGSNRTGRPFTGDASGKFMYPVLYETGFANQPTATAATTASVLTDLYITAAARCAPPDNKPLPGELANCAPLSGKRTRRAEEIARDCGAGKNRLRSVSQLPEAQESLIAGKREYEFRHGAEYVLPDGRVLCVLPSLQPEHADRQADAADVRRDFQEARRLARHRHLNLKLPLRVRIVRAADYHRLCPAPPACCRRF